MGPEMDYYGVLNVKRDAKKSDIALAYRKLAVKLCPDRDPQYEHLFVPLSIESSNTHMTSIPKARQWEYINMAYDILGNDFRRAIYDKYGEGGLLEGVTLPNGYFAPYQYHGDHKKVFQEVFGTCSPYAHIMDGLTNPPVLYSNKVHGIGVKQRDPAVEKILYLELSEVYTGVVKLMQVWRQEFSDAKKTVTERRLKTLTVIIQPGTTVGTRYRFKEEGDRSPTKIPADIVFITADKPHERFERRNNHDLYYLLDIDLCQALVGFEFSVETLDKRKLPISISDVVQPGFTRIVPNEGLPKCEYIESSDITLAKTLKKPVDFGDLIIQFNVIFPVYLSVEMRGRCRAFFKELKELQDRALEEDNPMDALISRSQQAF